MIYNHFELYNVAELIPFQEGGYLMSRLPSAVRASMGTQGLRMACNTAGCEFRFVLNSGKAEITLRMDTPGASTRVLLYFGGVQSGWQTLSHLVTSEPTTITVENHPNPNQLQTLSDACGYNYNPKVIRLVLESAQLVLLDAKGDVRPPLPEEVPATRFMMYGSSITHGSLACSANLTYLSQIARHFGYDFYSYGFAGACLLEKEVCDYISEQENGINDRRWDFAILELGINAMGQSNEEFEKRVAYLIDAMLSKNPGKKLFVIDIFYHIGDLNGSPKADTFREIVRRACAVRSADHPELIHIAGRKMLTSAAGLSGDFVHPNVDGVREIADNMIKVLESNLSFRGGQQ